MPWTEMTWDAFCSLLEHGWPGEFSADAGDAYRALLDNVEPERAVAALRTLLARGNRFRPSAAEIAGTLNDDPTRPTFTEALSAIRRVVPIRPNEAALVAAERIHPYLAAFIQAAGLDRLRQWPIDDPEYGQAQTKRLREEWDQFVARADQRVAAGLELTAGTRRQLGPRKLDFAGVLPAGPDGEAA
jgi:hypothetical protein